MRWFRTGLAALCGVILCILVAPAFASSTRSCFTFVTDPLGTGGGGGVSCSPADCPHNGTCRTVYQFDFITYWTWDGEQWIPGEQTFEWIVKCYCVYTEGGIMYVSGTDCCDVGWVFFKGLATTGGCDGTCGPGTYSPMWFDDEDPTVSGECW